MIEINQNLFIGKGRSRIVYEHPFDSSKVIKIDIKDTSNKPNNKIDFIYFNYLKKKNRDLSMISKCYEWIETNVGKGLIFEKIKNFDNTDSVTFKKAIEDNLINKEYTNKLLEELIVYLEKNIIIFADLSLDNILCKKINYNNEYKLIIIDGLGSRRFKLKFWLYMMSDRLATGKLKKQIKQLLVIYNQQINSLN